MFTFDGLPEVGQRELDTQRGTAAARSVCKAFEKGVPLNPAEEDVLIREAFFQFAFPVHQPSERTARRTAPISAAIPTDCARISPGIYASPWLMQT